MIENTRMRLRKYLEKKGYTVSSLEKAIGVGNGSIALFIQGKNKGLGNNLEKLLIHFEFLSSRWLLTGQGPEEIDIPQLESVESKNELYIKSEEKGVRIKPEKGGKDWGKDSPFLKNELYIKPDKKEDSRLSIEELAGIQAAEERKLLDYIRKDQKISESIASEPESAFYGDLADAITHTWSQQGEIMRVILRRIEYMERRLDTEQKPELPPGKSEF